MNEKTPLLEDDPSRLNEKVARSSRRSKCAHCGAPTPRTLCDACRCPHGRLHMLCEEGCRDSDR